MRHLYLIVFFIVLWQYHATAQCITITCPGDTTVYVGPNNCTAPVNYSQPTVIDQCALVRDTLVFTNSIDTWTVPAGITSITIEARGAEGGNSNSSNERAGLGAIMIGDFTVTPGSNLRVLVGEQPSTTVGNGGGGGTFVTDAGNNPLIVAGGGAGSHNTTATPSKDGNTTTTGGLGSGGGGAGGTNGNGGTTTGGSSGFYSGAGGGMFTDGADGWTANSGGQSFVNGGAGSTASGAARGGFGGGGSGSSFVVGGAGGGYSGGGVGGNGGGGFGNSGHGGGGGSFNGGTNQVNTGGVNSGHGLVIITYSTGPTGTLTQIEGAPSGTNFPIGVTTNTYVAANGSNSDTCSFTVTVLDTIAPALICPSSDTFCTNIVTGIGPSASDNCGVANITYLLTGATTGVGTGDASGSTFNNGVTLVTYVAIDSSGNSSTCNFSVSVGGTTVTTGLTADTVCIDAAPIALAGGMPMGGSYSGAGVSGATFDPAVAGVGVQTITYTYTDSFGCTNSASTDITVVALPTVTLAAFNPDTVCIDAAPIALPMGMPLGGTYTGTGVSGSDFDPAAAGVGTHTITYTFTDVLGCANSASTTITVVALPNVTLPAFSPDTVCINNGLIALPVGTPTGGSFTGTGVIGTNFDPFVAGVGTYPVTYTVTNANGCSNSASSSITVVAAPTVTLANFNPDTVCINAGTIALPMGTPMGGSFTGTGVIGANFDPFLAGVGTSTVTYTVTDNSGCTNRATTDITVNPIPNVTLAAFNPDTVCIVDPPVALPMGTPTGGTYSGNGVSGTDFDPNAAGAGLSVVTYTFTDALGCTNSASTPIRVVFCLNVNQVASALDVTIYPNPNQGTFVIDLEANAGEAVVEIHNALGVLVHSRVLNQQQTIVNMIDASPGAYFVSIRTKHGQAVKKILINR